MPDSGYVFAGVGHAESMDRDNEHRSGVPVKGAMALLQSAPLKRSSKVFAVNSGEAAVHARLRHQGAEVAASLEPLTALAVPTNKVIGKLQFGAIKKGSMLIAEAGALLDLVDDSLGNLYDVGFVGVAANKRGTVNYTTGELNLTWGAAPTEPVTATYTHTDYVDFATANQVVAGGAGALPYSLQLPFGRVVGRSVSLTDGVSTWVDDGKGNMLQGNAKRGTVDYASGAVLLTTGPAVAAPLTAASVMKYNPFAAVMAAAAGLKLMDMHNAIPEITNTALGGAKYSSTLGLVGETTSATAGSHLIVMWSHFSEEPFRVTDNFASFPAGGYDNDPLINHTVNHL